jgi:hypothetical protein
MADAGDSAAASGGSPAAAMVIDGEIADTRRSLSKVEQAIDAIYAAIERGQVLPKYKTEDRQDQELVDLKAEKARLQGILATLTSQRAQAQAQAGEKDCSHALSACALVSQ